jgi:large subunit ribosomal protein L2
VQSYRAGLPRSLIEEMGGRIDPGMLAAKICVRGNCLPVRLVPPGTQVYNVGSSANRGAVFCRSAGTYATVVGKDETTKEFKYMVVKLVSGETRKIAKDACVTVGVASNPFWQFRQLGKAGRSRWLGIRPSVRGVAMNACEFCCILVMLSQTDCSR